MNRRGHVFYELWVCLVVALVFLAIAVPYLARGQWVAGGLGEGVRGFESDDALYESSDTLSAFSGTPSQAGMRISCIIFSFVGS